MVRAQQNHPTKRRGRPRKDKGGTGGAGGRLQTGEKRRNRLRDKKKERKKSHGKKRPVVGDEDTLDCCVLLTRLEERKVLDGEMDASGGRKRKREDGGRRKRSASTNRRTKPDNKPGQRKTSTANQQTLEPKIDEYEALLPLPPPFPEPRRRRMASLNAEAFNSLLLFRDDPLTHLKKRRHPGDALAKSAAVGTRERQGAKTEKVPKGEKPDTSETPKKKKKRSKVEPESIDWLTLLTPTPRRQAGLTAATLLKLTSTASLHKRPRKSDCKAGSEATAATTAQNDTTSFKAGCEATTQTKKSKHHPLRTRQLKHGEQQATQGQAHSQVGSNTQRCCSLCKTESPDPGGQWKGSAADQECRKPGLHCRSMMGLPAKPIKEEQVETEVSPCYCCTHERCVEYCHRLALFLDEKNFEEPDKKGSLSKVFHHHHHHHHHHHLQSPHSIPHPAALAIGPHTTYTCFPGYYVHFSHADTPASAIPPMTSCPQQQGNKRPKLLPSASPQPSGIPHPVYCCTSVGTCYGEPCRISGYSAYASVIPTITRGGCSYSATGCSKCNHSVSRDDYSSALKDHHSPSSFIPIPPTPRTLTGCPVVPNVPPAGQSVPHVQTPLSDPSQPQGPPPRVARECPQSAKAPSGSRSGARGNGGVGTAVVCPPPHRDKKKQKPGSAATGGGGGGRGAGTKQPKGQRQKDTNGWRAVGLPFQKEVFTVGEETLVWRKCFEAVQRDGELIQVRDTVLLKSGPRKKSLPFVAKISALWEDPESGEMMMSLFWYYRPEHTQGGRIPSMHCENEIFASRHQDINSVACIEDKCYVLTLAQYCRFCALVKCRSEGVPDSATSVVVPSAVGHAIPAHRCVPDDVDPELVFVCRHVYDFRYGRLLKNLQ